MTYKQYNPADFSALSPAFADCVRRAVNGKAAPEDFDLMASHINQVCGTDMPPAWLRANARTLFTVALRNAMQCTPHALAERYLDRGAL